MLNNKNILTTMRILIMLVCFAGLVSCKDATEKKPLAKDITTVEEKEVAKNLPERITLKNTNLSLVSPYLWTYNAEMSKISESEMESYSNRVSYTYKTNADSFAFISCNTAKDDIKLSLEGAIEGGINNMAASVNGIISNRKDGNMEQLYGYPSSFSNGLITSKDKKITLEYYFTVIINEQKLYLFIGLFTPKETQEIEAFKTMLQSVQIQ